jgi:ABC-type multidrug transport system fused ATPase/permease subunit
MKDIITTLKIILRFISQKNRNFFIFSVLFTSCSQIIQTIGLSILIPFISFLSDKQKFIDGEFYKLIRIIFDGVNETNLLFFLGYGLMMITILGNILMIISTFAQAYVCQIITREIQNKLFKFYLNMNLTDVNNIDPSQKKSNLNIIADIDQRFLFPIAESIPKFILVVLLLSFSLYLFFYYTLIGVLITTFTAYLLQKFSKKKVLECGKKIESSIYVFNKLIFDVFQIIKIIRIDQLEKFFSIKFEQNNKILTKSFAYSHSLSQLPKLILEMIMIMSIVSISIHLYQTGNSNLLTILSFFALFGYKTFPYLSHLYSYYTTIQSRINSFNNIKKDILNCHNKNEVSRKISINFLKYFSQKKELIIKIKKFSYENKIELFKKQIIKIELGKIHIIQGPTGKGKSTLFNFILGFVKNTNVQIYLDKTEITSKYRNYLNQVISYVPQKNELFIDTIKNNIIFDKVITDEQFWKICEIAGLTNFINKLPQKENTIIDESYRNISGGQAQRISIARALVKNPKILLLDESTSQIDTKKEKNILSNIIRNNITVILITHRSENIEALKSQLIVHKLSGKIFRK